MAFVQGDRLVLADPAALNHVLTAHTYDYAKPDEVRGDLAMVLGKGVVFAEGAPDLPIACEIRQILRDLEHLQARRTAANVAS